MRQHFEQGKLAQAGGVANVLANQTLRASGAPSSMKGVAASQERLGESTQPQQGLERILGSCVGTIQLTEVPLEAGPGRALACQLCDGEREQAQRHIAPEQAVPAALVHIQAAATRHHEGKPVGVAVEGPLEVVLPACVLVELVKNHQGWMYCVASAFLLEEDRILRQELAVAGQIPVEVSARSLGQHRLGQRRLPHLTWPRNEDHLAPVVQHQARVVGQHAFDGHSVSLDVTLKKS
jgi:hypothetical protein